MSATAYSFVVRRMFQVPRTAVFEAFTQAEAVAQWFKPSAEVVVDVLDFAFVVGGGYRLRYRMPDGRQPVLFGVYEAITRPEEIVFSWGWSAPDPHSGIDSRVRIQLFEKESATEMVVTHEGTPSQVLAEGHAAGWQGALDCLERLLA